MTASLLPQMTTIGFIGLGVMGKAMAKRLRGAGYRVVVHNRSRKAVDELIAEGALDGGSPRGVAETADVLMLCLPDTGDVEAVLFSPDGVAAGARDGLVVIDTSSISSEATKSFAERLSEKGITLIDSPVTGGPKGATDGTLTCLVGGDAASIAACEPIFRAIAKKHIHLGPVGSGQLVKACNQLVIAATLAGVSEAIALCMKAEIDPSIMQEALLGGSAQSFVLQNHATRLIGQNLAPGFRSTLMLKDLNLAAAAGQDLGVFMPTTNLARSLFTAMCSSELRDLDSAALGLLIQALSGVTAGPAERNRLAG